MSRPGTGLAAWLVGALALALCLLSPAAAAPGPGDGPGGPGDARLDLELTPSNLVFLDADPDLVPWVPAWSGPLQVLVRIRGGGHRVTTLTVQAQSGLLPTTGTGAPALPASYLRWTGSGAGFVDGTVSATTAQLVAQFVGGGTFTGTLQFFFRNLWEIPTGSYQTALIFTLTMP